MGWLVRSAWGYLCGVALAASLGAAPPTLPGPDATPPAPDAPAYTVRLTRPARVGDCPADGRDEVRARALIQLVGTRCSPEARSARLSAGWRSLRISVLR